MRRDASSVHLLAFMAGVTIGVAAGVLLAPGSGSDTRRRIARSADDAREFYERGRALSHEAAEMFEEGRRLMAAAEADA
ncbi:MAG TPA: YtxH domain-containing protein [Bryobacteraceae bacterium]|nr:YtxH domain-containing protein [Bryobacteraceae bacterium]